MYQKTGTLQLPVWTCVRAQRHTYQNNSHGHTSGLGVVLYVGMTLIKEEFCFEKKDFSLTCQLLYTWVTSVKAPQHTSTKWWMCGGTGWQCSHEEVIEDCLKGPLCILSGFDLAHCTEPPLISLYIFYFNFEGVLSKGLSMFFTGWSFSEDFVFC